MGTLTAGSEIAAVWDALKGSNDASARDHLIIHYSPLVKYVAGRVAAGLPQSVDSADLVSYGMFGLIDAIEKFDLGLGYQFETYSIPRIRGAILDELRALDWVPRSVRRKSREITTAMTALESELKRSPSDDEIATQLGWTTQQLATALQQISVAGLVSMDEMVGGDSAVSLPPSDLDAEPGEGLARDETRKILREGLGRLSERERALIGLYYFEGMTLAEIGEVFGVTESRACQIHAKAVLQLRSYFKSKEAL